MVAIYADILGMIKGSENPNGLDLPELWEREFVENGCIYSPLFYSLDSSRNLSYLSIALANTSIHFSSKQLDLLRDLILGLANQMEDNVSWQNYYYLRQAALTLNMDLPDIQPVDDGSYFCNLYLARESDDGINKSLPFLDQLLQLTISKEEQVKGFLNEINIWDYEREDNFPYLLNLYVELALKTRVLDTKEKNAIISWIKGKECPYGYKGPNGNYDFEISVVYTHILNLLNGDRNYDYYIQ